jgi:hypothetical protein
MASHGVEQEGVTRHGSDWLQGAWLIRGVPNLARTLSQGRPLLNGVPGIAKNGPVGFRKSAGVNGLVQLRPA